MQRPAFDRWIRRECLSLAGTDAFSLPKLAALAQSPHKDASDRVSRKRLAAALHLYAMANGCEPRLASRIYDPKLQAEQQRVSAAIGARDPQRLALRNTPLLFLPTEYRELLSAYHAAYYTPERLAEEKRHLQQQSRQLQLQKAIPAAEIARAAGIAPTNATAYLTSAKIEKVTVETARQIQAYLQSAPDVWPTQRAPRIYLLPRQPVPGSRWALTVTSLSAAHAPDGRISPGAFTTPGARGACNVPWSAARAGHAYARVFRRPHLPGATLPGLVRLPPMHKAAERRQRPKPPARP